MKRFDITEYLIHSVRKSVRKDFPSNDHEFDENNHFPLVDEFNNEFDVLINIIREGGLRASFSFRNGRATIYGDNPVICFTEMPLINLLQYVKIRGDRSRFTEYGIAILKKELYANGGRPVISGLAADNEFEYSDSTRRIISPDILPLSEQFRYVKLDLTSNNDWTHEREWRISCKRNDKTFTVWNYFNDTIFETYGINIFSERLFSEVVIIVNTEEEAEIISKIVRNQLDAGYCKGGEEFYNEIKYLIVQKAIELMDKKEINSIEDLPNNIYYKQKNETLSLDEKERVNNALRKCSDLAIQFANDFFQKYNLITENDKLNFDVAGFAFISSYASDNKFYRYLLTENLATSFGDYIWLEDLQANAPRLQSLTYQEYIANKQCEILNRDIEEIFFVHSNLD